MKNIQKDKPLDRRFTLINHCNKMRKANCERDENGSLWNDVNFKDLISVKCWRK